MTLLAVNDLGVGYGDLIAVHGVSFSVDEGTIFVLLGANGAGKSSVLRCISGLVAARSGRITALGASLVGLPVHRIVRAGISHVPEGRRIFPNLTVMENLVVSFIPSRTSRSLADLLDEVWALFPQLAERKRQISGTMSGGEQQMLAIGRAIMNSPKLLMLDEPSLGLSPLMAEVVFERLVTIRQRGTAILLVEQNASCIEYADGGLVLANGRAVLTGNRQQLEASEFVRRAYLGA
jgi:branched-chain amino acid transport system ATP-binding protein